MDDKIFDQIQQVDLKKTMESSYIDYAMSVIASRALPDVRDGLKPVQRRVLYSMVELGNTPDKPHRKCARIVGDTMGKYHPHGDSSIYGALVNMAQDWSMRYTLVDGHGNFGSVDGDGAAAMRYTEARLSKISLELIKDIGKNTVDFEPNFDETEKEPTVLPSRYPNLLVNGTTGIAVGMATNIPPHNLREVVNAVVRLIDNDIEDKETTIDELIDVVKGPDFPTGGIILGTPRQGDRRPFHAVRIYPRPCERRRSRSLRRRRRDPRAAGSHGCPAAGQPSSVPVRGLPAPHVLLWRETRLRRPRRHLRHGHRVLLPRIHAASAHGRHRRVHGRGGLHARRSGTGGGAGTAHRRLHRRQHAVPLRFDRDRQRRLQPPPLRAGRPRQHGYGHDRASAFTGPRRVPAAGSGHASADQHRHGSRHQGARREAHPDRPAHQP